MKNWYVIFPKNRDQSVQLRTGVDFREKVPEVKMPYGPGVVGKWLAGTDEKGQTDD